MKINWLLQLYPQAWRERYADEMLALLTQHSISSATWLDLTLGALDAHLHPQTFSTERMFTVRNLRQSPQRQGVLFGLLLGGAWLVYNLINNTMDLSEKGAALLNNSMTLLILLLFASAGISGAWNTRSIWAGIRTSLWTCAVGCAIGLSSLWFVTFFWMDTIRHNHFMLQDFARSGMRDMDGFIIEDALGATFFGLLFQIGLGIGLGALGGWIAQMRWVFGRVEHR